MSFPNGEDDGFGCPLAPDYEKAQGTWSEMLTVLKDVRHEIQHLRESLVGPATDENRINIKFVKESNKRADWITAGLIAYCLLLTIWFTGVKPSIERRDGNYSVGFRDDHHSPQQSGVSNQPKNNQ